MILPESLFTVLVWSALALVVAVFVYEVYIAVAR